MRSQLVRWASLAYVVVSLLTILWLSVSVTRARSFHSTALAAQAALLGNSLLGASQDLVAVSAQGGDGRKEETARLLVSAQASLAQVEIVALGYEQISGNKLPLSSLTGIYTAQIRGVREDLASGGSLTPDHRKVLSDVKSDLELLSKACQGDVLARGNQDSITSLFQKTGAALAVSAARASFEQTKSP